VVVVPSWRKSAVILGMKSSKLLFWAIVAGVAPIAFATPAAAEMAAAPSRPTPDILQDYTYGYAPVVMTATRSVNTAVPDASSSPGRAPIDQFARLKMLATPAARLVRRPNADTLYTLAWFDLAKEPIVLHVPDTAGRYYLIPLYDAYSNEFASIGSRTTGNGEGDFAIVGPLWQGQLPKTLQIVSAPTDHVWVIARTLVRGGPDLANTLVLTSQYQLVPLSAYPQFHATGDYSPPINVPVIRPNPDFVGAPITSSPGVWKPGFFEILAETALRNPPSSSQAQQADQLVRDGLLARTS